MAPTHQPVEASRRAPRDPAICFVVRPADVHEVREAWRFGDSSSTRADGNWR